MTEGSPLKKRSMVVSGHATSLALEPEFWRALELWARDEGVAVAGLVARIDAARAAGSLASAIRVAILRRAMGDAPAEER
ncbi:MAG: ribbon-helix-helix domain-containing protein [Pseudomonadota bacterium]